MKYRVDCDPFPVLLIDLDDGESIMCQRGGMSWMSTNLRLQTTTGGFDKAISKMLTRESMFQNIYTSVGGSGEIAFGTTQPGMILPIQISATNSIVAQKSSYMASELGVELSLFFQKRIRAGFFGGEGFIMQKFTGHGMLFIEIDGSVVEYTLAQGESKLVNTGSLAAMEASCSISIESVKGIGNKLFSGEGFFHTRVSGPGKIWLQTMPINVLARAISAHSVGTN
ncbi:MAG: TIGR00266 family protein [Oscillospiraceae bacterium]|nr:TIGR00266 family protein [Oscillospiraceae bacterium]